MDQMTQKIIEKSKCRKVSRDTILLRENEVCRKFVFLKSGIARHFLLDINGNEITKNFSEGPCFVLYSISSFLSQIKSRIQFQALTDLELYELDYDSFLEMKSDPQFLELWNNMLSCYINKKERKEISLLKDDSTTRYLEFLKDFPNLINKIPHYFIASYLSISPETLSRIRKKIS